MIDVAMLIFVAALMVCQCTRTPSLSYDVDRGTYPIKGLDLSAHNQVDDYGLIADDTVRFVMLKVTEGIDFCDAKFGTHYNGAREAGLKVGAYHFFRFNSPGDMQARHFMASLAGRTLDMPLILDVEKWGNASSYDVEHVRAELRKAVETIRQSGYPLMIYTNRNGYETFIRGAFDDVPLWICSLSHPPTIDGWTLWQHSHRGSVRGVRGYVDINTYNGTVREFDDWCRPYTL